ncbi:transcriptional regulator [Streptomyces sp. NPDC048191]|uniref:transcriptional regulator n=1 Tax=Streptomyces sp. NPDC048191 TaxID=3155484 RepID=UPI0033E6F986
MLATPSDTLAYPDTARQRRLAAQLASMIPGAATIRVSLTDPAQTWPHPHTVAKDAGGARVELSRTTARVAARWIMRVWPDVTWTRPHTFDLATATFTSSDFVGRGR